MGGNGDDPPITLTKIVVERSYQNKAFTIPRPKYVKAIIITMKAIASNVSLFFSCFMVDSVLLVHDSRRQGCVNVMNCAFYLLAPKSLTSLAIASKVSKRERSEHGKKQGPPFGGLCTQMAKPSDLRALGGLKRTMKLRSIPSSVLRKSFFTLSR